MAKNVSNLDTLLEAAHTAPVRGLTSEHLPVIEVLRAKGYSWRDVATFLTEHGFPVDHTKVFRFMSNDTIKDQSDGSFAVPAAGDYIDALRVIDPPSAHRAMLGRHHNAHNRCVTFSQLASAAGYEDFRAANLQYGTLGRRLGETLGMEFATYGDPPKPFFSSAIGCGNPYRPATNEFELLMHHELAHALDVLAVEGFFGGAARGKER